MNQSGSYYVSAFDTTVGCSTNSNTVNVLVLLPNFNVPISTDQPNGICSGTTANLSASSGYSSYSWSTGATNASINISTPGTYTLTVTYPNGGCTGIGGLNVSSLPVPDGDILINNTFSDSVACEGETIELVYSELDVPTVSFQWRRNGIVISGAASSSYDATETGYYICQMQKTGGCNVTSTGYQLTFLSLPVVTYQPSFGPLCLGASSIALSGGLPAGGNYTINGSIATSFNPPSLGVGSHQVMYNYTDNNGCTSNDGGNVLVQNCVGIDNIFDNPVMVYPNPFEDEIIISGDVSFYVELNDIFGKLVCTSPTSGISKRISTGHLSAGLYFVKITTYGGEKRIYRIIKN